MQYSEHVELGVLKEQGILCDLLTHIVDSALQRCQGQSVWVKLVVTKSVSIPAFTNLISSPELWQVYWQERSHDVPLHCTLWLLLLKFGLWGKCNDE
jgi:hypothetical protein